MQLRLTVLWKSLILSGGGMLLGIALGLLASPYILGIFIGNLGMARFPFDITVFGTLLVIPVCIGIVVASTWLPSGKVLRIRPRALIME